MNKTILATLCYIEDNGKILMLHRVKKQGDIHKDKWNGVGGKLESGESPKICALREIKEETGLTVNRLDFCGHIAFPKFDGVNDWHCFLYYGSDISGDIIDSPEGVLEWIDKDKVLDLPLWEGDKVFIPWVLGKKHFMAKFIYDNGVFKSYEVDFI